MKHLFLIISLTVISTGCESYKKISEGRESIGYFSSQPITAIPTVSMNGKKAIVRWGQSNAQGRGQVVEFQTNPRLSFSRQDFNTGPINYAALKMVEAYPAELDLLVIDCTTRAFPDLEPVKSLYFMQPGTPFYSECMDQVARAKADGRELIGIMFYQGEQDSRQIYKQPWEQWFKSWIGGIRKDLGYQFPIVFAQLGSLEPGFEHYYPHWEPFKQMQASLSYPYLQMVKTDDQPSIENCHHDYAANVAIGERFYQAFMQYAQ